MQVLTINGAEFRFSTLKEQESVTAAVSAAMVAGGAFVDVSHLKSHIVSVLVGPHAVVHMREESTPAYAIADSQDDLAWIDDLL